MAFNKVEIPDVRDDARIGSVFNGLFKVINLTEQSNRYEETIWDFNGRSYLHPFFICGLSLYRKQCSRIIKCDGLETSTKSYLNAICFEEPMMIGTPEEASLRLSRYLSKTYIPICKFNTNSSTIDSVTSKLQDVVQRQCSVPKELFSALSYLIGEIVDNIHDHSCSDHGYIFSQYLNNEKCLNICIADFGISIFGSFSKNRMLDNAQMANEGYVLSQALHHKSTKNLPNAENRGYGLPTSKKMIVEGMGGSFFLLSGGAFHRHDINGETTVTLPKELNWDGTIVLLRIPLEVPANFNYLKYIERI